MTVPAVSANAGSSDGVASTFDIIASYTSHLQSSSSIPMPIASIFALCDLITQVPSNTTSELITLLDTHSTLLKRSLTNPVPATAGLDLFARLVITMQWDASGDFELQKRKLVDLAREYAEKTVPSCREKIVNMAKPFVRDDAVILTHSYSRVVMQILLAAAKEGGNSISVYVTESRPGGLGLKTYDELTAAGIPTTVICDSAAAYIGEKIDFVHTGAEGVCESGGILNAVGTLGLALVAKSYGKPFYAAAESFKFLRLFPLSQFDLPTSRPTLTFIDPRKAQAIKGETEGLEGERRLMTKEMDQNNPAVDYTLPNLVTFIFSDVGSLRPSGVGDALLAVYGGNAD